MVRPRMVRTIKVHLGRISTFPALKGGLSGLSACMYGATLPGFQGRNAKKGKKAKKKAPWGKGLYRVQSCQALGEMKVHEGASLSTMHSACQSFITMWLERVSLIFAGKSGFSRRECQNQSRVRRKHCTAAVHVRLAWNCFGARDSCLSFACL
jgi:hypothetical protein